MVDILIKINIYIMIIGFMVSFMVSLTPNDYDDKVFKKFFILCLPIQSHRVWFNIVKSIFTLPAYISVKIGIIIGEAIHNIVMFFRKNFIKIIVK